MYMLPLKISLTFHKTNYLIRVNVYLVRFFPCSGYDPPNLHTYLICYLYFTGHSNTPISLVSLGIEIPQFTFFFLKQWENTVVIRFIKLERKKIENRKLLEKP